MSLSWHDLSKECCNLKYVMSSGLERNKQMRSIIVPWGLLGYLSREIQPSILLLIDIYDVSTRFPRMSSDGFSSEDPWCVSDM